MGRWRNLHVDAAAVQVQLKHNCNHHLDSQNITHVIFHDNLQWKNLDVSIIVLAVQDPKAALEREVIIERKMESWSWTIYQEIDMKTT